MKVLVKCQRIAVLDGALTLPRGVVFVDEELEPQLAENVKELLSKYPNDIEDYEGDQEGKDVRGSRAKRAAMAKPEEKPAPAPAAEEEPKEEPAAEAPAPRRRRRSEV